MVLRQLKASELGLGVRVRVRVIIMVKVRISMAVHQWSVTEFDFTLASGSELTLHLQSIRISVRMRFNPALTVNTAGAYIAGQ